MSAVLGAVFVALLVAVAVRWSPLLHLDRSADVAVHGWLLRRSGAVSAARLVTWLGDPRLVTALTVLGCVVAFACSRRRVAAYLLVVRAVAWVLELAVKAGLDRARPQHAHVFATAAGSSFPSGHSVGAAALWVSLALAATDGRSRLRPPALLLAGALSVAVAASRVALGVHYLSDVAGGLALGWGVALLIGVAGRWRLGSPPSICADPKVNAE
ncbi:MAG: phosphatase PAP2 family protein [Frankiales bacterium]|nr:phosphatase PAP2 family protein [Frankiales bacterium]